MAEQMDTANRVCVGAISGARGLGGEIRINSFMHDPDSIADYGPLSDETGERSFELRIVGRARKQIIARIAGVEDRTAVEALKGVKLYLARDTLPEAGEDEFYHADLVGLVAERIGGEGMGTVRAVHDFGAGVMLEIGGGEEDLMVPFTKAAVPVVDIAAGKVVIDPPAGLLEPPEEEAKNAAEEDRT